MNPDAAWPALPGHTYFTDAEQAAHRSPKGTPYPEDLLMPGDAKKAMLKFARKPHLKLSSRKGVKAPKRKKKER